MLLIEALAAYWWLWLGGYLVTLLVSLYQEKNMRRAENKVLWNGISGLGSVLGEALKPSRWINLTMKISFVLLLFFAIIIHVVRWIF